MAAVDSKGGSDLDVFEGLGKKNTGRAPASGQRTSVPPPPPSIRRMEAQKHAAALAETAAASQPGAAASPLASTQPSAKASPPHSSPPQPVATPAPQAAHAAPAAQPARQAPPTPGRGTLPPVIPPPSKAGVGTPPPPMTTRGLPAPPPTPNASPAGAAQPAAQGGGLAMDWDDEEEATHVLDRDAPASEGPPANGVGPAAGTAASPYFLTTNKQQTALGMGMPTPAPQQPPGARPPSLPPPPPSGAQGYARPPATLPPFPAAPGNAPAGPNSARPVAPPPALVEPAPEPDAPDGAAATFPYQATTTPMAMPSKPTARAVDALEAAPVVPPAPFSRSRLEATALLRPQPRPVGLFIAAGVGVLALAGIIFFLMPRTGQIAVNVADARGGAVRSLTVSIDGKPQCDSAPCVVHNLPVGPHTVKVEASGYQLPADKAVAVESGKDVTVDFTMLTMAPSGGTGIKVTGGQPGEKLYVDDKEIGALPQELHDLTPGSHKVRVAAGERYAAVEKNVTIARDEFQDLGSVTLKVVRGRATVSLSTAGATVFLLTGGERRELTTLPVSIDLPTDKQYSLLATKAGYNDYTQPLNFDDGQAEKSFVVSLDPKAASPTQGSVSFSPPPIAYTPPAAPASPRPAAPASHKEPAAASAPATGEGTLNMNSIPASSVTLDGKPIGSTPQIGITVSAGSHTVVFTNAEQGFKKTVTVSVAAGETKKVHP